MPLIKVRIMQKQKQNNNWTKGMRYKNDVLHTYFKGVNKRFALFSNDQFLDFSQFMRC